MRGVEAQGRRLEEALVGTGIGWRIVAETDFGGLPCRSAKAAHDVPHDRDGTIADLIRAFDAGLINRVAEQRGFVADFQKWNRPPVVQVDVADGFVERRYHVRCIADQETWGAECRGIAALP